MRLHIDTPQKLRKAQLSIFAICAYHSIFTAFICIATLLMGKESIFLNDYPDTYRILIIISLTTLFFGYIALSTIAKNVTTRNILIAFAGILFLDNLITLYFFHYASISTASQILLLKSLDFFYIFTFCYLWHLIEKNNTVSRKTSRYIELNIIISIIYSLIGSSITTYILIPPQVILGINAVFHLIKLYFIYKIYTSEIFSGATNDTEYYAEGTYFSLNRYIIYWGVSVIIMVSDIIIPYIVLKDI